MSLDSYDESITVLYAPMLVTNNLGVLSFIPYDNLTDSPFVIFDNTNILTINIPAASVNTKYEANKTFFYPNIEDLSEELKNRYGILMSENLYDFKNIKDMMEDFLKDSKS